MGRIIRIDRRSGCGGIDVRFKNKLSVCGLVVVRGFWLHQHHCQSEHFSRKAREIKRQAYQNFKSGLHCAEVVSKTILNNFCKEPHPEAVKASSYFGGGIAGTMEELCGAFTGGVIALGILLGRENPGDAMREGRILFGGTGCFYHHGITAAHSNDDIEKILTTAEIALKEVKKSGN